MGSIAALSQQLLPIDPAAALNAGTKQYIDAGDLDAERAAGYPMDAYGFIAVSRAIDTLNSISSTITVNTIEIMRVYVPAHKLITGAAVYVGVAGTTPGSTNASGYALYSDDGATRLAITANDYTLFTSTGWRPKAFTGTVAAQSAGYYARLAMIHSCSGTAPGFGYGPSLGTALLNGMVPSGTHRRAVFALSTTTFPTSFNPATFGTLDNPVLFIGLY